MNWNPFKRRTKTEKPKSDFQKALEANEAQKEYKPNRQVRRSKNIGGTKRAGKLP